MKTTNFDLYLAELLRDPAFAKRFERAGQAWDTAIKQPRKTGRASRPVRTSHKSA